MTIIMVMAKKQPFTLVYADEMKDHLRAIEPKYHSVIQAEIETQLLHEPDVRERAKDAVHGGLRQPELAGEVDDAQSRRTAGEQPQDRCRALDGLDRFWHGIGLLDDQDSPAENP